MDGTKLWWSREGAALSEPPPSSRLELCGQQIRLGSDGLFAGLSSSWTGKNQAHVVPLVLIHPATHTSTHTPLQF